jgi:hypothetical protein
MVKLAYDSEKRVTKMIANELAFTFSDHYFLFYYKGTDKNAYLMKDSLPPYMANDYSVVHEHKLYYDNQDRKILDTTRTYHHSLVTGGRRLEETNVTNFHYTTNYMTYSSVPAKPYQDHLDTLFFGANGDALKRKRRDLEFNDNFEYHNIESPYGRLNVANSLFRVAYLHSNVFTPNMFEFEQPKHLVKTLRGIYDYDELYTLFHCYYQTDAGNRVDGITFARYEYYGTLAPVFQWYASMKFYYHQ